MERESFEDLDVANYLNEHFVSIKVDREERPDIDHVYMTVCQAITGQGGWPLSIVMTPEQAPFFAGTYFPRTARFGHPGFLDVLQWLNKKWMTDKGELEEIGRQVTHHLSSMKSKREAAQVQSEEGVSELTGDATAEWVEKTYEALFGMFDDTFGGFGNAPKFPSAHQLLFLLRYAKSHPESRALYMVERTLNGIARGGIRDHVGGGFSRYSTDERWLVPHFEKMLYDNALLLLAYAEVYAITRKEEYRGVMEDTVRYVLRDLTSPEGGFYCAEDADSEGVEGKFYVWTKTEVLEVLGEADGGRYCRYFGITEAGNFEGRSIPNLIHMDLPDIAEREGLDLKALMSKVKEWNRKLFSEREARIRPHRDDKVLTSWNGLMMAALARAGRILQRPDYIHAALNALAFVERHLVTGEGKLLARYRDGHSAVKGFADDYAFLAWGALELYAATFDPLHLQHAIHWTDELVTSFWDTEVGGFFMTAQTAEQLITRPKEGYDGAIPSANSVAMNNLLALARLTGNVDYEERAAQVARAFEAEVLHYPAGFSHMVSAVWFAHTDTKEVVVAGPEDEPMRAFCEVLKREYVPDMVTLYAPRGQAWDQLANTSSFVQPMREVDEHSVYICRHFVCESPIHDLAQASKQLFQREMPG